MKFRIKKYHVVKFMAMFAMILFLSACVTKKKRGEVSKLGKFYHNTTSEYNGYFNANELMTESVAILRENSNDNYSNILDVYDFVSVNDPKMVYGQLDKAVEKVTRVAAIHSPGEWVDDCYVLMGKAQFIKQDYETSVETFEYFQDEFNPANPFGRNYQKRKLQRGNSKASAKERKKELEAKQDEREDERKATQKDRESERKAQQKKKEEEQKARQKAVDDRRKSSKKSSKNTRGNTRGNSRTTTRPTSRGNTAVQKDTTATTTVAPKVEPTKSVEPAKKQEEKPKEADKAAEDEAKKKEKADQSAYNEGMMWLARGYTRTEQYSNAEYLLKRIDELDGHNKVVKQGWHPSMADLMIKQKRYSEAIIHLEQAIENAPRKEEKARYAFIAGQLQGVLGQYAEAGDFFEIAKKKAGKDFKLRFMSELNQLKNYALGGKKSQREIETSLEKMLTEEKNKQYKDQIYFALGDIAYGRGDKEKAIENYSLSVRNNVSDQVLKSEAYYKVANMFYEDKQYLEAKLYFDSTAIVMVVNDPRKSEVEALSKKLSNVAAAIKELNELDTLMAMANMDKDELMKIAKERKANSNAKSNTSKGTNITDSGLFIGKSRSVSLNSTFFAYNPINIENGKKEFKEKWGQINLEDNWRRSNKSLSVTNGSVGNQDGDVAIVDERISDEEFEKIMADVPFTPENKADALFRINTALYKSGSALKLDLEDYKESNKMLERLLASDLKGFEKRLDALYLLYTNYMNLGDQANANRVKNMLLQEFPESNYAKIINDPSYVNQLISESLAVDNYYEDTYKLFEQRSYANVVARADEAAKIFGEDNVFKAKFSLIKAMSTGFLEGKEAYLKALQETVVRYPGTPEETKAKEILRFLKGDEASFREVDIKEVDNIYSKEDATRHYVAVVLFDYSDKVLQEAKIAVSNYNKEYFKLENLQLGDQILSKEENTQVILVRSFENMAKARKYYDTIIKDQEKFIPSSITAYEVLPVTQRNFRKMVTEKSHAGYRAFFEANYK